MIDRPIPRKGFGRIHKPDSRDLLYPMRALMATPEQPKVQRIVNQITYRRGPILDQGQTGTCVGHGWRAFMNGAPIMTSQGPTAMEIYDRATQLDDIPDNDHDTDRQMGSTVRGGAQVLMGIKDLATYVWASNVDDMLDWMLSGHGGVVMGTNWYRDMMDPDQNGVLHVRGPVEGGHCWYVFGANETTETFTMQNSWGTEWGGWTQSGRHVFAGCARVSFTDMARLLREDGEACTATEQRLKKGG
jgi:hypothetical protein